MSRYKFFDTVELENGKTIKGFMHDDFSELIRFDDDTIYYVPKTMEYRPDLIAYRFYKNPNLSYILIYANQIDNSPEGFYYGREIRIPRYERIINII